MNQLRRDPLVNRLASAGLSAVVLAAVGLTSGCGAGQEATSASTRDAVATPDPTASRALDETALELALAFAHLDRGTEERTEAWLSQLRGDFESADGVEVGNGHDADDGLVLLTHTATSTYKCIAVTGEADAAGESVEIARISTGQPRC